MPKTLQGPQLEFTAVRILRQLKKLVQNDAQAMANAQILFDQLAGATCTQKLVQTLQEYLLRQGWEATCPLIGCAEPSVLSWRFLHRRSKTGVLEIKHSAEPRSSDEHLHTSTTLPRLVIAEA